MSQLYLQNTDQNILGERIPGGTFFRGRGQRKRKTMMKEGEWDYWLECQEPIWNWRLCLGPVDVHLQINLNAHFCLEFEMNFKDWSLNGILSAVIYD